MNGRFLSSLVLLVFVLTPLAVLAGDADEGVVVRLWTDQVLGDEAGGKEKSTTSPKGDGTLIKLTNVTDPIMTVYKPTKVPDSGTAVIVCPGGGYGILAYDLEGTEVCEWLNSIGVTGVLLKYRVPRRRDDALKDAQRAVSIVRSRAAEWKIDPKRIGILGFSAGGHLAARTSTNYKKRAYEPIDKHDEASCRPDFAVLIYPAYLTAKDGRMDSATLPVNAETPTTFIAIAANDKFTLGALQYSMALKKAKVRSELHVFQFGGHGCGLRKTAESVTTWPEHCERWLRGLKFIPGK
jgi:acetyl esterase/lipase